MGRSSKDNRDYYIANRDEINRRKRERYRKDKKYREAAKKRAQNQTLLKKVGRIAQRSTVVHAKRTEQAFTLSELCKGIDRNRDVIFRWRKSGVMPQPTHFHGSRGVYAASQLGYIKMFVGAIDQGADLTYRDLGALLKKVWNSSFSIKRFFDIMKALSKRRGDERGKAKSNQR